MKIHFRSYIYIEQYNHFPMPIADIDMTRMLLDNSFVWKFGGLSGSYHVDADMLVS